jgi:hypothetical protein
MKIGLNRKQRTGCGCERAFSLTEFSVAMTIFFFVTAGMLTSYIFGLKMHQLTTAKLGATGEARKAIAFMVDEIRSANRVRIGTGTTTSFAEIGDESPQSGGAVQIHATTNLSHWTRYFRDASTDSIRRITDSNSVPIVLVNNITNEIVFASEDFRGTVLTNRRNNRVVGVDLAFSQVPYAGEFSDYYRLRFKVTRRRLR